MKTLFKTLAIGAAAFAVVGSLSAQNVIRITGSSAYRGSVHNAILNLMGSSATYGYTGNTGVGKATSAIFTGTIGGNTWTVKTTFTGSVGGVQTVAKGIPVSFLANGTTQTTTGQANASTAFPDTIAPDAALTDVFQSSTAFTSPVLTDIQVGVVPFVWAVSTGSPTSRLNNITSQQARALFKSGNIPLAAFTGLDSDRTTLVSSTFGNDYFGGPAPVQIYAIGRDIDSGTRVTAFVESGIGITTAVQQYLPTLDGGGNITNQALSPADSLYGISFSEGGGGYNSGGTLAGIMAKSTLSALGGYYLTYLSTGDATGLPQLSYNGVPYSLTALYNGQYTFWSYEHFVYNGLTGLKKTVADLIANQIKNTDATVKIVTMQSKRTVDGGVVTTKY